MEKREIIIDLLGSDLGPEEMLEGARLVLEEFPGIHVALAGPRKLIEAAGLPEGRWRILEADKTVTNLDNPIEAFYSKEPVSVFKALEEAGRSDEVIGLINAGNTGALFAGAIRFLLADKSVRPCIAAILPTAQGGFTCLVDTGASIDCGPEEIAALFARVPGLDRRFVAAHLGGFSGAPPHAVDRLLDSACFIDTAVLAIDQPQDEPRRIMAEWPADRMIFGTDYYWTSQRQLVEWVKDLRPDPADREKIFHLNAERLLGHDVTARTDGQSRDEA